MSQAPLAGVATGEVGRQGAPRGHMAKKHCGADPRRVSIDDVMAVVGSEHVRALLPLRERNPWPIVPDVVAAARKHGHATVDPWRLWREDSVCTMSLGLWALEAALGEGLGSDPQWEAEGPAYVLRALEVEAEAEAREMGHMSRHRALYARRYGGVDWAWSASRWREDLAERRTERLARAPGPSPW